MITIENLLPELKANKQNITLDADELWSITLLKYMNDNKIPNDNLKRTPYQKLVAKDYRSLVDENMPNLIRLILDSGYTNEDIEFCVKTTNLNLTIGSMLLSNCYKLTIVPRGTI